jgi:hypothetical protein
VSVLSALSGIADDLLAQPHGRMALRLTALFLLATTRVFFAWHPVSLVAAAMAVLMLLSPRLLASRWAWGAIAGAVAFGLMDRWPASENNRFLDLYWLLACTLAAGLPESEAERLLARHGRLLIGLTFTLAATQKAVRGEYWDGGFMHGLILWDERFRSVAMVVGGLDAKDVVANSQLKNALAAMPSVVESVVLITTERLRVTALLLGYFVLALEAAVGLSFLLPRPRWMTRLRHYLLFLFVLPTYLLAQVSHFGIILAVMGFAQCPVEHRRLRLAYVLVFAYLCFADFTGSLLLDAFKARAAPV